MGGGSFLMGTDYEEAFPDDGEGPVREIELKPFWIDKAPVTNALFEEFVKETGYRTAAERFGWTFWGHVPKERFHELVVDTVAAAPWWAVFNDRKYVGMVCGLVQSVVSCQRAKTGSNGATEW